MESDYIRRADAKKTVCGDCEYYATNDCEECRMDRLTRIPTADVRPVKRGEWMRKPDPYGFFEDIPVCSECGCTTKMREEYNFCPNCGADTRPEGGAGG